MKEYIEDNKISFLIIIFLLIFCIILTFFLLNKGENECFCRDEMIVAENVEESSTNIFVEVKGYVKKPNVYEIKEGSIINDVILLAGGFKDNAYTKNINLSKKLEDEMVIYVYSKTEYKKINKATSYESICATNTTDITSCISEGNSVIKDVNETYKESTQTSTSLININTAEISDFLTLPSIGEAKAKNIVNYRNENGLFSDISEIKNVTGIGDNIYEQIKDYITI